MTAQIKVKVQRKATVKLKTLRNFPAGVVGSKFITIAKAGGIYTIGVDYTLLDPTAILDPATSFFAVFDAAAGLFKVESLASLLSSASVLPVEPTVVTTSSAAVAAKTHAIAVNRASPSATSLTLPTVAAQAGVPLHIVDWSTSVTDHTITITPNGSETIMRQASWGLHSNAVQLGSLTLYPSTTLSGWYMAP